MLPKEKINQLNQPMPHWAVKKHPVKSNMTVIDPMAVIDRLNEVFGVTGWNFEADCIAWEPFVQKTTKGDRNMFRAAVKGTFTQGALKLEQFGGSSNDDLGDALKGGATDALTKIASYLGIGASIYKGMGNTANEMVDEPPAANEEELEDDLNF